MFYQILRGVYTSNLFKSCVMDANNDYKGKINHSISGQKILKPAHSARQRDAIAIAILNA